MEKENKEIAIKGIALLLQEKAVGIKNICEDIKIDGKVYDSQIITLNTVTENMKKIIETFIACKDLPVKNKEDTKGTGINEQKK